MELQQKNENSLAIACVFADELETSICRTTALIIASIQSNCKEIFGAAVISCSSLQKPLTGVRVRGQGIPNDQILASTINFS